MVGGVVCPANVSAVEWYENLRSHDILRRKVTFMFGGVERAASGRHQGAATQNKKELLRLIRACKAHNVPFWTSLPVLR